MYNSVPFSQFPILLIKEMVTACVFWLNMFPPNDGVSPTLSPWALMSGFTLDYAKHCWLEFGSYVQTHEDHDNSMQSRTTGAIALHPTGNQQGGYYFMSLTSGRHLTRNHWTLLPIPQDVINRVNILGCHSHAANTLTFAWSDGTEIVDDDPGADPDDADDDTYHPDDNLLSDDDTLSDAGSHDEASVAGVNDTDEEDKDNEHEQDGQNNELDDGENNETSECAHIRYVEKNVISKKQIICKAIGTVNSARVTWKSDRSQFNVTFRIKI
jgi:hypothetical protein